jgi:hypothetical protein
MNRRRFLKYAGASAAVIGASALGVDFFVKQPFSKSTVPNSTSLAEIGSSTTTVPLTSVETATTEQLTTLSLGENDLGGYVFHDYNGNGILDESEPTVDDVEIVAEGNFATVRVQPQRGLYVFRNLPNGSYRIYPVHSQNKFRYMCRSNQEVVDTSVGYSVVFNGKQRLDMALMEGFLTVPFRDSTKYFVGLSYERGRYYDRDPSPLTYLWWNGKTGEETIEDPYGANHTGTDFGANYGEPVVASAPGTVDFVGVASHGEIYVQLTHGQVVDTTYPYYGIDTAYFHLSKTLVLEGQRVSRGDVIGLNGSSGTNYPHAHLDFFYRTKNGPALVDPYRPLESVYSGPYQGYWLVNGGKKTWVTASNDDTRNRSNYWTKENDPQYPRT